MLFVAASTGRAVDFSRAVAVIPTAAHRHYHAASTRIATNRLATASLALRPAAMRIHQPLRPRMPDDRPRRVEPLHRPHADGGLLPLR